MRSMMIAGNWKMNGSKAAVNQLIATLKTAMAQQAHEKIEMVLLPSSVYLSQLELALSDTSLIWGAQNLDYHDAGAFTGEISGAMLIDFNCHYVLVGHSERRSIYFEDNAIVAKKCLAAAKNGLKPILCVGETLEQRQNNETFKIITQQLNAVFQTPEGVAAMQQGVIAYEPVWAIGTGVTANSEQAQEVHQIIRLHIAEYDSNLAQNIRIIYGGSVKADNAYDLFAMPDVDGGLVGGASLIAQDFLNIYQAAKTVVSGQ